MGYQEFIFRILLAEDFHKDLLINALSDLGFDSFEDTEEGFKAYITQPGPDLVQLEQVLHLFRESMSFEYQIKDIPWQNWNELWENNFEPILIDKRCYVRATFHEPHPEYEYEIVVDPKMAFGTGHHQTTSLMMKLMMAENFKTASVLDMGCGTGILAILASMLGAEEIVAIDYDPVCFESTVENGALNYIDNITPLCGSLEAIPEREFDVILANINRNILLGQMEKYTEVLKPGGKIFFSGFYEASDLPMIREKAESCGLIYELHEKEDNWVAARFHFPVRSHAELS